jgi:hypothetical protein
MRSRGIEYLHVCEPCCESCGGKRDGYGNFQRVRHGVIWPRLKVRLPPGCTDRDSCKARLVEGIMRDARHDPAGLAGKIEVAEV